VVTADPRLSLYVVVAYDVESDVRRERLAGLLEGFGERVQRSVFECDLNGRETSQLIAELIRFAQAEDLIRVYRLPPHVAAATVTLGGPSLVKTEKITIL
jgi:CRISPR-associated protein Cas2